MQQHSLAGLGLGGPAAKGPAMPRIDPATVQLKKTGARRSSIGGAPSELSAMQAEIAAADAAAQREREAKEAAERAQRAAERALSSPALPTTTSTPSTNSTPQPKSAAAPPARPTPSASQPVIVGTIRRGKEKQCNGCGKEFGLLRGKNKCAACGNYFCSKCVRKAVLSKFDKKQLEVCANCYNNHHQR